MNAVETRTVGLRSLVASDAVPVHVLYPADVETRGKTFGPYTIEVAEGAPVTGDALPVVAISHGTGGTPWSHRVLASHLARAGFAVALVVHPGNTRGDNALEGKPENLANRPRHVRVALDAVFADPVIGARVVAGRAAVIGHSLGAYTALAAAGGTPHALPSETPEGRAQPVPVEPDPRIAALVLLAPALPWFMAPGALADVRARLFVRTGERDDLAPPYFVEQILRGVVMDYAVVPGAGHFAFLSPFPPALTSPFFAPSQDPPGFDRVAYQARLCAEVTAFLLEL